MKTLVYRDFDLLCDAGVDMMDVLITYRVEHHGIERHPYGQGYAEEDLGYSVELINAVTVGEVRLTKDEGHTVIGMINKGTDITTLPGWKNSMWDIFEEAVSREKD